MGYANCAVVEDGSVRICGDYKATVNAACVAEHYPLPVIDNSFTALHKGDVCSTLDLRDIYNQIPLNDKSRKLTTISTHIEWFSYNRLSFRVLFTPAIFQHSMESVLDGLSSVQAY